MQGYNSNTPDPSYIAPYGGMNPGNWGSFWGDGTSISGGFDNGFDNAFTGGLMDFGSRGINSVFDPMDVNGALMAGKMAVAQGYGNAMGGMQPYYQGGLDAFGQLRGNTNAMGNYLGAFGPMGAQQWASSQQTPQQYYQNIMSGYQQSPQAAYAQQQATRAGNAAAAASGMMGSGAYMNGMQRNANQISQTDQQQYFNNTMSSNQAQMQSLQDYQNQYQQYMQMLAQQAGMGFNAANSMGNWSMDYGKEMNDANGGLLGNVGSIISSII